MTRFKYQMYCWHHNNTFKRLQQLNKQLYHLWGHYLKQFCSSCCWEVYLVWNKNGLNCSEWLSPGLVEEKRAGLFKKKGLAFLKKGMDFSKQQSPLKEKGLDFLEEGLDFGWQQSLSIWLAAFSCSKWNMGI